MAYQWKGTVRDIEEPTPIIKAPAKPMPVYDPEKCGSTAGYKQHQVFNEEACPKCKDALASYSRAYRARVRSGQQVVMKTFSPDKCGTYSGYASHKRYDLKPCKACLVAYADYMHAYRAKRKAAA